MLHIKKAAVSTPEARRRQSNWKARPARTTTLDADAFAEHISSPSRGSRLMQMTEDILQSDEASLVSPTSDVTMLSPMSFQSPPALSGGPKGSFRSEWGISRRCESAPCSDQLQALRPTAFQQASMAARQQELFPEPEIHTTRVAKQLAAWKNDLPAQMCPIHLKGRIPQKSSST